MQFDPEQLNTLVVKIGTNLLRGRLEFEGEVVEDVVKELCELKAAHDLNVLIVSSGAIGCGMQALDLHERPDSLPMKQAVAAVGQSTLMHYYETLFKTHGKELNTAQVLVTLADLDQRQNHLNLRNTLRTLFEMKHVIPIINENDSTAVDELRFSDNDTLAARVAAKTNAGLLIILTDVDGLYDRHPGKEQDARLIEHVEDITPEMIAQAGGPGTAGGTGGMRTKLQAARIACAAGVPVAIANGHHPRVVHGVLSATVPRTTFAPSENALPHRKRWIAFGRTAQGTLHVDQGAQNAIVNQGTSLLPVGLCQVVGDFDQGAAVTIASPEGTPFAQGLVNYASGDLRRIQGCKSAEIESILGYKDFDEVVHRDNLVVL